MQVNGYTQKKRVLIIANLFLLLTCSLYAQKIVEKKSYSINLLKIDSFRTDDWKALQISTEFNNRAEAYTYVNQLSESLHQKGYTTASIDTAIFNDTTAFMALYLGEQYQIEGNGYTEFNSLINNKKWINNVSLEEAKEKILAYYENNGYPFASVYFDSVDVIKNKISVKIMVNKGRYYTIDSIRLFGSARISQSFLQHYLFMPSHSKYDKQKLNQVDKHLKNISFLQVMQATDITMLPAGGILNVYLQPKRCNQFNLLIGLQPSAFNKSAFTLTGDLRLDLNNSFGKGENIFFSWQQLQPASPRLNLAVMCPYVFRSSMGVGFSFDLFKKDSNFIQINSKFAGRLFPNFQQTLNTFVQFQNTSLLQGAIDTTEIKLQRILPINSDMRMVNMGIDYSWNTTDYKNNPSKGDELTGTVSVGVKKIPVNNDIANIKDPNFRVSSLYDSIRMKNYQIRMLLQAAHYFPLPKKKVFKICIQGGFYQSPTVFRNDLFQIGGNKILRGFDEESIYATMYAVGTLDYRILTGLNSYFSIFSDIAMVQTKFIRENYTHQYASVGASMIYETKNGVIKLTYAVGKREDLSFNWRKASKLHVGYVNYF